MAYKPISNLYVALRAEVLRFFSYKGMSGWDCLRANQPIQQGQDNNFVVFHHISTKRLHKEYFSDNYNDETETMTSESTWFQSETFQLDIRMKNGNSQSLDTFRETDVCINLAMWLNTREAIERFKNAGYGVFPIDLGAIYFPNEPSGEFRIFPSFDITFNLQQSLEQTIPYATSAELDIKRV